MSKVSIHRSNHTSPIITATPDLAQGAAQATEDAATLRAVLSPTTSPHAEPSSALHQYESQRLPRATCITANTRLHQEWLHVHDGPVREERDRLMQIDGGENPVFWAWEKRKDWLFGWGRGAGLEGMAGGVVRDSSGPAGGGECL